MSGLRSGGGEPSWGASGKPGGEGGEGTADAPAGNTDSAALAEAFPSSIREPAAEVLRILPPAGHASLGSVEVVVEGEAVAFPYRIHHPPVAASELVRLPPLERLVLGCIYSRHGDGHIRQQNVAAVAGGAAPWVVPFVVQLIGEYVVEIVEAIDDRLAGISCEPGLAAAYTRFFEENPAYVRTTRQRAISYWSCYYRDRFAPPTTYPGVTLLDRLSALAPGAPTP